MRDYFFSLMLAAVIGGLCSLIAGEKYEKHMKFAASLVCLCLMLLPLKGVIGSIGSEIPAPDSETSVPTLSGPDLDSLAREETKRQSEKYICDIISGEFGINPLYADIEIDWREDGAVINRITVGIADKGKKQAVEDFLKNRLGGEAEVVEG